MRITKSVRCGRVPQWPEFIRDLGRAVGWDEMVGAADPDPRWDGGLALGSILFVRDQVHRSRKHQPRLRG